MVTLKKVIFQGILLFFLFGAFRHVEACSCAPSTPCENYQRSEVVFTGKVVKTESFLNRKNVGTPENPRIRFSCKFRETALEVVRNFKGAKKGEIIKVYSGCGGGDCGYPFKTDETYVVFSSMMKPPTMYGQPNVQKLLWTSICSGTTKTEKAEEALNFLQNRPKRGSGGTILGGVSESVVAGQYFPHGVPFLKVKRIKAQNLGAKKTEYFATADQKGFFSMNVPPGNYLVSPILPPYLAFGNYYSNKNPPVKVEDARCVGRRMHIINRSEMKGKAIYADGKLVSNAALGLVNIESYKYKFFRSPHLVFIGKDGTFSIKGIPVGKYYLALNGYRGPNETKPYPATFYPGTKNRKDARIFRVELGSKFSDIVFKFPKKLEKQTVFGRIVWKNGDPVKQNYISFKIKGSRGRVSTKSDESGKFRIELFRDSQYEVEIWRYDTSPPATRFLLSPKFLTVNDISGAIEIRLSDNAP
ncbi:MAG: hypothetical protein HKN25_18245 [Pyrinomonadaceae bacterium]|nr:hypothetical protein [Pyrinomonadaceae bacterium]